MERKKHILIIPFTLSLLLILIFVAEQSKLIANTKYDTANNNAIDNCKGSHTNRPYSNALRYSQKIYQAYISGNMKLWEEIVKELEKETYTKKRTHISYIENELSLLNFYYGLTGYLIATGDKKKAEEYLSKGESIIDRLLAKEEKAPIIAYKVAFLGFRMGLNRFKAVVLGPKSISLSKQAMELDSLNSRVLNEIANVLYYSPSFAGGNKQEALRRYEKAISIMRSRADTTENWNYLSLLANTGQAFQREGNKRKAIYYYKMALQNEPDFEWVRDKLLPSIE